VAFYVVEPESAGRPLAADAEPVTVSFDTWLGDDLVRAHPLLLATTPLKDALERLPSARGFEIAPVQAGPSAFYRNHNPGRTLPRFWSIRVHGRPGIDDLGRTRGGEVVASGRVVEILGGFATRHATLAQFAPAEDARGSASRSTA
jgi:hypothetical protein